MTVRVRFAPSPTGYLHIGGARTALYCYLLAKSQGGQFVLRIEDTDTERSKKEYEEALIEDLEWCGISWDEGPNKGGEFGPYRQSERLETYKEIAMKFVEQGKAYPCFLSSEELEQLTEKAQEEKKAPHTYHSKYRDLSKEEAQKRIDAGEDYVIRFRNPEKSWTFQDIVRGEVTFPADMVGDFVILRATGLPVYNFACAVDDHLMKMTHVIRAEEHLPNTVRQLIVYEAMGATAPVFCHVSLLVGEDRQKLSKRHGATSVNLYKDQNYLPEALINYLCLLGWSHPEEKDIFKIDELGNVFDFSRFNKAPALYDINKLKFFNEQHLRLLTDEQLITGFSGVISDDHSFHTQSDEWKNSFVKFYRDKVQLFDDIIERLPEVFSSDVNLSDDAKEVMAWETTPQILTYLKEQVEKLGSQSIKNISAEEFGNWLTHIKGELKIKGKPLFMGVRVCLTGENHGPDLKELIPLTSIEILKERLEKM